MSPRRLPLSRLKKSPRRAGAVLATAAIALSLSGMATVPAQSAADDQCLSALPVDQLRQDLAQAKADASAQNQAFAGLPVTTKTVVDGTSPTEFTGRVKGVLNDGIAPGLDMILVDFGSTDPSVSTAIDKNGIWEGMSGSPVYYDGQLLGAVAYSLTSGISTVAGVTPAAEMEKMLTTVPGALTTGAARTVSVPKAMASQLVASGAATPAQVAGGIHPLKLPYQITGLIPRRTTQLAKALGVSSLRPMGTTANGNAAAQDPIVAGGNLAASISYGDVTAAGVGTATAVCGSEVLAFGHPMNFTGASTMTLHGADAILIQPGPNDASFKVANLGAPAGTIDQDHLAGLHGVFGTTPATTPVTSYVTVDGSSREGSTQVSVPSAVPDIALANVVGDQDRQLDAVGGGSGTFGWTINAHRRNGTPFVVHRTDAFADRSDISYATVLDLADLLYTIQGDSGMTIDSVTTHSTLSHQYVRYTIRKVQIYAQHAWHTLSPAFPVPLRAGSTARLQVVLGSDDGGTQTVRTDLPVPLRARGKIATLRVTGGDNSNDQPDSVDVFDASAGPVAAPSVDEVVQQLRSTPHHNDVLTVMNWFNARSGARTNHRHTRVPADHVVGGSLTFQAVGMPRH